MRRRLLRGRPEEAEFGFDVRRSDRNAGHNAERNAEHVRPDASGGSRDADTVPHGPPCPDEGAHHGKGR